MREKVGSVVLEKSLGYWMCVCTKVLLLKSKWKNSKQWCQRPRKTKMIMHSWLCSSASESIWLFSMSEKGGSLGQRRRLVSTKQDWLPKFCCSSFKKSTAAKWRLLKAQIKHQSCILNTTLMLWKTFQVAWRESCRGFMKLTLSAQKFQALSTRPCKVISEM